MNADARPDLFELPPHPARKKPFLVDATDLNRLLAALENAPPMDVDRKLRLVNRETGDPVTPAPTRKAPRRRRRKRSWMDEEEDEDA